MVALDEVERPVWLQKQVRDLTENWEIPLGAELEKYLDQLEKIEISFDGGKTTLNFIEAAMFIQGSACVYSRKVEYLYSLAIATLEIVSSRKNQLPGPSVDEQGNDKDITFDQHKEHDELLDLDDIKESDNIELKEEDASFNEGGKIIPRIPFALMPKSEMNRRGEDVLLNQKGEVIGSRNDFKLNTCILHSSGALLMDVNSIAMLEKSIAKKPSSTPAPNRAKPNQKNMDVMEDQINAENGTVIDGEPNLPMEVDNDNQSYADDADAGCDYDDDYDHMVNAPSSPITRSQDRSGPNLRARRIREIENARREENWEDPWEELDPYAELKFKEKPFRKGKTFKIPQNLKNLLAKDKKRKRKSDPTSYGSGLHICPIAEFCGKDYQLRKIVAGNAKSKGKWFSEFEYLSRIENEKRKEARRRERKLLASRMTEEQLADIETIMEPAQDDNDDDDYDAGFDAPCSPGPAQGPDEDPCFDPVVQEDPLQDEIITCYEDLVRQHIHKYIEEAENYAQQTELTRRVKEWQDKILPVLEEEDKHRPYDIHQYGTEILDSFSEEMTTFKDVVKTKERHEICRYFLSTLLLANMNNVEIIQPEEQLSMDMIKLKLLDKTPAHHAISNYRAPSLL